MTDDPENPFGLLGVALQDFGKNLHAQSALGFLMRGEREQALAVLEKLPTDWLMKVEHAATALENLASWLMVIRLATETPADVGPDESS